MRRVGSIANSAESPNQHPDKLMKNKPLKRLHASTAAGSILALSACLAHGAITLDSSGTADGASSLTSTVSIDGSGIATASGYTTTGTVNLALGTTFGLTIDAVAVINTTVGVNYGAESTDGTIDRAANGDFGVQDNDLTGPNGAGIDLNEGFIFGINANSLSPTLAWKVTGILVSAFQPPNEVITIVNRTNTNLSMVINSGIVNTGTIDVSSLGIIVQGGTSNLDAVSVFMSSNTAATQNFRISGIQLEAIPEPSAALLGSLGLLALLRRRHSC